MKELIYALYVAVALSACEQDCGSDAEADFAEISRQLKDMEAVLSSGLPMSTINQDYLDFFVDDLTLLPPGRRAIQGRDAALEFYNDAFGMLTALSVVYEEPEVLVDGNLASRRYTSSTIFQIGSDSKRQSGSGRYIDILQKQTDGSWLIVWHAMTPLE